MLLLLLGGHLPTSPISHNPQFDFCRDKQVLRIAMPIAAVLFIVLRWRCVGWVRGGVAHVQLLLVAGLAAAAACYCTANAMQGSICSAEQLLR